MKFVQYDKNEKYAIYKNLLQFFIVALLLNVINFVILIIFNQFSKSHSSSVIGTIYFFLFLFASMSIIIVYFIQAIQILTAQKRQLIYSISQLFIILILTLPMLFMLLHTFIVYSGWSAGN